MTCKPKFCIRKKKGTMKNKEKIEIPTTKTKLNKICDCFSYCQCCCLHLVQVHGILVLHRSGQDDKDRNNEVIYTHIHTDIKGALTNKTEIMLRAIVMCKGITA